MIRWPQKKKTAGASAGPAFRPSRAPGGSAKDRQTTMQGKNCRATASVAAGRRSARPTNARAAKAPTFALLREKRELRVRNPENGARFTISLRDWQAMLWAVRVHPEPQWRQPGNAYTTAHRIMPRHRIEEWLGELRLD